MKDQSETFMVSVNPSESSSFSLHNLLSFRNTIKKKEMKRRFSDEQIKSLEYSFESESRPDSNVKHEIAGKLELHPRQVSIWFQNRRARLKSKQIEREFGLLKADYDSLASSFEALKRENDLLSVQLQKLKSIQANPNGSRNSAHHQHNQREFEESSIIQLEPFELKVEMEYPEKVSADDHMNMNSRNGEEEGLTEDQSASACDDSLAMASSTIIPFDSKYFLEESSCSSQWWELWS